MAPSALVQRNLDLLANCHKSADFLLICGEKHWHLHQLIIEDAAPDFWAWLSAQADNKDRVYLDKTHDAVLIGNILRYIYTLDYTLWPILPKYANTPKMGRVAKHVVANALSHRYEIPKLAQESKSAFGNMRSSLTFDIIPSSDPDWENASQALVDSSYTTSRAVAGGAELTMIWRDKLDPAFENWFVWWLKANVPHHGKYEACPTFWKTLDGKVKPLAVKAGLRRCRDGTWDRK